MGLPRLTRTPPHRHTLKLLLAPLAVLVVATNVANVMWPTLSQDHPLLLIALSSINRYLLLVSDQLDPLSYYAVGTARLFVSDPLFFLLGYWYGDRALAWMDDRAPSYGTFLRRAQGWFASAAWLLVLVAPNNYICLFAGAAGMRFSLFFVLNLTGTLGRLYLLRVTGEVFAGPIDSFRDVVGRYQWWLVAASAIVVAVSLRRDTRRGGDLDDLRHLDELAEGDRPVRDPEETDSGGPT